jgi:hypothetical protein
MRCIRLVVYYVLNPDKTIFCTDLIGARSKTDVRELEAIADN